MIVAITGGTGFVGSILVDRLLAEGHKVRVLTRNSKYKKNGVTTFVGDLLDESVDLDEFVEEVDVLYHCCGELADESKMKFLHVDGTKQLLNAAAGTVGRWVQLSSVGVYGRHRSGLITEKLPENPIGEYERTKAKSDHLVKSSGIPSVLLRPSIVFGEGMPNQSLHQFIDAITSGRFFYIGKEGASLNYVHVDDVIQAMILCGSDDSAIGSTFNLSDSIQIERVVHAVCASRPDKKVRRLPELPIRILAALIGWTGLIPLTSKRVNALTGRCVYDSSKIQELLGFQFESTLEERFQSFAKKNQNKKQK